MCYTIWFLDTYPEKQCAIIRASENDDLGKHGSLKGFSKSFSVKLSHSNWGS